MEDSLTLIGMTVILRANEVTGGDVVGRIKLNDKLGHKILIQIQGFTRIGGASYSHAVCEVRGGQKSYFDLSLGNCVSSNIIFVPEDRLDDMDSLDTAWWRGGAAVISDICREK